MNTCKDCKNCEVNWFDGKHYCSSLRCTNYCFEDNGKSIDNDVCSNFSRGVHPTRAVSNSVLFNLKDAPTESLKKYHAYIEKELKNRSDKREQLRNKLQSEVINLCRECRDNGFKLRFDLTDKYMYELLQEHSVYAYVNELYVEDDKNK